MEPNKQRSRLVWITVFVVAAGNVLLWRLHLGWSAAAAIAVTVFVIASLFAWRTRDELIKRFVLLGILLAFGSLPSDFTAVSIFDSLVYQPGGPFIWKSPVYMLLSWSIIVLQLGYLALWLTHRIGLLWATLITGILGGINIPVYEYVAKDANLWIYRNCRMVLNDATPLWVIAAEVLLTLAFPLCVLALTTKSRRFIPVIALGLAVWMWLATFVSFKLFA